MVYWGMDLFLQIEVRYQRLYNLTGRRPEAVALHPDTCKILDAAAEATLTRVVPATGGGRRILGMQVYLSPLIERGDLHMATVIEIEQMLGICRN